MTYHNRTFLAAAMTCLLALPKLTAGMYATAERLPITVDGNGFGVQLTFGSRKDGVFPQLLSEFLNALDSNPARKNNPDRQKFLDHIADLRKRPASSRSATDVANLGAAYARVGMLDDAVAILAPRGRDRTPDFRVLVNLAHVHATRGEWREALEWHVNSFDLEEFPDDLFGTTPAQRKWLKNIERNYYRRWLTIHRDRAMSRTSSDELDVLPLFETKFINSQGIYEPGQLAATEQAKLPADAVAIVQQLILWAPWDTDLYWLLAELYASEGRLREAEVIFNQSADGRQFANRKVFMSHRAAIREAVANLPPEATDADEPLTSASSAETETDEVTGLPSYGSVIAAGSVFALVAITLITLQVRASVRRRRVRSAHGVR